MYFKEQGTIAAARIAHKRTLLWYLMRQLLNSNLHSRLYRFNKKMRKYSTSKQNKFMIIKMIVVINLFA